MRDLPQSVTALLRMARRRPDPAATGTLGERDVSARRGPFLSSQPDGSDAPKPTRSQRLPGSMGTIKYSHSKHLAADSRVDRIAQSPIY